MKKPTGAQTYTHHPVADVFPMMSGARLDELGNDIKKNGLRLWDEIQGMVEGDRPRRAKRELLDKANGAARVPEDA